LQLQTIATLSLGGELLKELRACFYCRKHSY